MPSYGFGYIGNNKILDAYTVIDNGLGHVDITDADVRTGKVSIGSNGEPIYGNAEHRKFEENTSDATATPKDINIGKTGYVNGVKITGEYTDKTLDDIINGNVESYTVKIGDVTEGTFVKYVYDYIVNGGTEAGTSIQTMITNVSDFTRDVKVVRLSNNKAMILYISHGENYVYRYLKARVLTITGSTIILGTELQISPNNCYYLSAISITENKVLVVCDDKVNGVDCGMATVLNIENTNILIASQHRYTDITPWYNNLLKLDNNTAIVAYYNAATKLMGEFKLIHISSDDTITSGPAYNAIAGTYTPVSMFALNPYKILLFYHDRSMESRIIFITRNYDNTLDISAHTRFSTGTFNFLTPIKLYNNKILLLYKDNDNAYTPVAQMITINNDNTITVGSQIQISTTTILSMTAVQLTDNKVCLLYTHTFYNNYACALILNVDNDTVTWDEDKNFIFTSRETKNLSAVLLQTGKILVGYLNPYITTQAPVNTILLTPDLENDTVSTNIIDYTFDTTTSIMPLEFTNDSIAGIAKTSGNIGDTVEVYIP